MIYRYRPRKRIELKKLLRYAMFSPCCMGCGKHNQGDVVAAHSNWQEHGKGMGRKADDCFIAFLCSECHRELDQGASMSYEEKKEFWRGAHDNTTAWLWESGHIKESK